MSRRLGAWLVLGAFLCTAVLLVLLPLSEGVWLCCIPQPLARIAAELKGVRAWACNPAAVDAGQLHRVQLLHMSWVTGFRQMPLECGGHHAAGAAV